MATTAAGRAPTKLVNGYLQGVRLPEPGSQHVLLEYQPAPLRWGLAASAIGLLLTITLYFWKREQLT
jgi:uncharacterized membrane protein YfhO